MVTPIKKSPTNATTPKPGILQTIKNKIIDKTSDVLSLPARLRAKREIRQSASDTKILKKDAETGGNYIAPDASDPKWRTRSLANEVRERRGAKY